MGEAEINMWNSLAAKCVYGCGWAGVGSQDDVVGFHSIDGWETALQSF